MHYLIRRIGSHWIVPIACMTVANRALLLDGTTARQSLIRRLYSVLPYFQPQNTLRRLVVCSGVALLPLPACIV